MIDLLDVCPMPRCRGELEPHCIAMPGAEHYSHTCDIMRCQKCGSTGSIDGRYWPNRFACIDRSADALRADLDERVEDTP